MAIDRISDVFAGATISGFNLTIPSGSLVSCPLPASGDPNEIIFGLLENVHRAVASGLPTYVTTTASASLISANTYRRSYTFNVDLDFDGSTLLSTLDVKDEPAE